MSGEDNISEEDIGEICIVVAGSVNCGKSSFLGVMVNGGLDDGNGLARRKIAKHPHEIETGRTSDIITHTTLINKNKQVTFVDLCGHEKYLKSTIHGITSYFPDYGILIVAANRGVLRMTKEHLKLYICLDIPFIVLITRIDIAPQGSYDRTVKTLKRYLKKYNKKPHIINSLNEITLDKSESKLKLDTDIKLAQSCGIIMKSNKRMVPVISISNKTGYYLEVIRELLGNISPRKLWEPIDHSIFYITDPYSPQGVGLVVAGTLKGKTIPINTIMYLGPFNKGFIKVRVWSIHDNNRRSIQSLLNHRKGCIAFRVVDKKNKLDRSLIKRGMILISDLTKAKMCYKFKAKIKILHHSTIISQTFESVINCNTVQQTAKIILDKNENLKTGDIAEVCFEFKQRPEFMEIGSYFVFREGSTRGRGIISEIYPYQPTNMKLSNILK